MPLSDSELDAIQARADAATEGPWYVKIGEHHHTLMVWTKDETFAHAALLSCFFETDAAFIAAARTDVPALLAECRRLRKIEAEARRWLAEEPDPTGWILLKPHHLEAMRRAVEASDAE